MRNLVSKLMTGGMIAGAALLVSACGGSETANTADTNMAMDNMSMESDMGTMNDVSAVDAAGADANMSMDNSSMGMGMDNSSMGMDNSAMAGDNMSNGM
ncbi:hypothetical protein [Sphingomonas jatrophae]|uniref:Pentapeptide MXKDX repeat protein n=1 Tax=Sphingomonas jatrophae TaxID=1166337 RepID=A0A1I6K230_9SPHN|nr:hypothetical protein [Sphingomonas jatrophae]SFR85148.1 hypothetical protein SAMN05192580_1226 [Sphingomonas jatrophae]